ncbi:hypothetical protein F2Q68_00023146 [Brassica cretica]|uniref:Uncharacterized protein n=1 Tax=Brassica cretica TaxID=69181 RepID=A0A8S9FXY7_BRACR|nr:hypothetical protein F2Q68_00023146 [Brassica cretica]KAF3499682.1 hypothetical protein F2Q69_00045362 [Brassica cretica]
MDQKELDQMRKVVKELKKELKAMGMARKTVDVESYIIKTKIKNIKEELDHKRKVVKELEMDHLICDLENGLRSLDDLSQTEVHDLKSYTSEKIAWFEREIGRRSQPSTSANEPILGDDIPKASDVAPEGGPSSRPSGDDDDMKTSEGESSKSGGADDA